MFFHMLRYELTRTEVTSICSAIFWISLLQTISYLGKNPYIEKDYHTTQCIQYDKDILEKVFYNNVLVLFLLLLPVMDHLN